MAYTQKQCIKAGQDLNRVTDQHMEHRTDPDTPSAIAFVGARQPCRSAWTSALTGPALQQGRVVDLSTIETARDSSVQAP